MMTRMYIRICPYYTKMGQIMRKLIYVKHCSVDNLRKYAIT